jgi:hypothetical protein
MVLTYVSAYLTNQASALFMIMGLNDVELVAAKLAHAYTTPAPPPADVAYAGDWNGPMRPAVGIPAPAANNESESGTGKVDAASQPVDAMVDFHMTPESLDLDLVALLKSSAATKRAKKLQIPAGMDKTPISATESEVAKATSPDPSESASARYKREDLEHEISFSMQIIADHAKAWGKREDQDGDSSIVPHARKIQPSSAAAFDMVAQLGGASMAEEAARQRKAERNRGALAPGVTSSAYGVAAGNKDNSPYRTNGLPQVVNSNVSSYAAMVRHSNILASLVYVRVRFRVVFVFLLVLFCFSPFFTLTFVL